MSYREFANGSASADTHAIAAEAFVDCARSRFEPQIAQLFVFGSTVRGETRGLASNVDVLVVLESGSNEDKIADELRDLAYDIMLEYGPVVELHVLHEGKPYA